MFPFQCSMSGSLVSPPVARTGSRSCGFLQGFWGKANILLFHQEFSDTNGNKRKRMTSFINVMGILLDVLGTFSLHKELIGNSLFVHRQQTYTTTHTYKAVNLVLYQNSRIDCPILFSAFDKMSLLGKVALVTGASSGIGAATAIQLAK